jgi:CRP/FNR family cyclic AMP-dependent transcriptional regulator
METRKLLEGVEIFKGLTSDELSAVEGLCTDRHYRSGDIVFDENSRGAEMYLVRKGKVRIDLSLAKGSESATVHRVGDGELFGELALVDTKRRSATATCEKDSEIITIDRDKLLSLFESNNHAGYVVLGNLATILAGRLRRTNLQLVATLLWK